MVATNFYTGGEYLKRNAGWHVDASPWKTKAVLQVMRRNSLHPKTVCEIGCGAGEILRLLQSEMESSCTFIGYDIAPQAIDMAKTKENERLQFRLGDVRQEEGAFFDLILIIDVLEHFEDCFGLLRDIKSASQYKIFQLPLDIAAVPVVRNELVDYRHTTGHLHFFTKDIALEILQGAGYEVLDAFYVLPPIDITPWSNHPLHILRKLIRLTKRGLQRLPGNLMYLFHHDLAVRTFGGWKLMILVK